MFELVTSMDTLAGGFGSATKKIQIDTTDKLGASMHVAFAVYCDTQHKTQVTYLVKQTGLVP